MAYEFYLGKMLCPIAPSKLDTKIKGKNKTVTLINEGEINILKMAGLTEISFDLLLPNVKYPFASYKTGFKDAKFFLDQIEELKVSQKPFQFIVTRTFPNGKMLFNTNMKVSLEDYTVKESATEGFDVVVSIKLKQYKDYGTKVAKIISEKKVEVEENRPTDNAPSSKLPTTYTVQSGDCLWNIAKEFYGNGSKYNLIFNANKDKIKNANLIYPNQVLTIPKE